MPRVPTESRVTIEPRKIGSKKVRPCDNCRRQKHSCHINVPGQPCTDCAARNKECTFIAPPMKRHGKTPPKESSISKEGIGSTSSQGSDDAYYDSLDMEYDDYEESHYLGPSAIAANSLAASLSGGSGTGQKFRQVSDGPLPALFVRNPALLYGRLGPPAGTQKLLDECVALLGAEKAEHTIQLEPGSGTYPATFLAALMAHTTYTYLPMEKAKSVEVWSKVLAAFEDEYRLPRLITLQTTLMVLLSNPHENHAQNSITLGRLTHGDHIFKGVQLTQEKQSMLSFIGMAKLCVILERITQNFQTVQAVVQPPREPFRSLLLESIASDLDEFDEWLEPELRLPITPNVTSKSAGVRSMQAAHLGVKIALIRLTLGEPGDTAYEVEGCLNSALQIGTELVEFLEAIDSEDRATFWFPYSAFHFLNGAALLVRVTVKAGTTHPMINFEAGNVLTRLATIIRAGYVVTWPTAVTAKGHFELLLRSLEGHLPLAQTLLSILSDPPPQDQLLTDTWGIDMNAFLPPMTDVEQQLWSSLGWLWDTQGLQS
ncbi:uncharacterized protein IL334_000243 [Kwoniella shivajii]|uniref:Zn(2)-C6 fungal-type domain-containing protein n=1 Tax=Kwoniella shivajii TaxID=564305 RepID=A0ABZ1CNL4_9TREE|nr:hypothetical protein IL334_000243 [Kwoniella shivajii]